MEQIILSIESSSKPIEILLVEDNPGDVRLTQEVLKDGKISNHLSVVEDGAQAIEFLCRTGRFPDAPRPDLILLDLNLPRKDGREVLAEIKLNEHWRRIPVIVLTAYDLHANCYITKPIDLEQFIKVIRSVESFWLAIVKLPSE
jgi:CheY-like chemotaxis protein